LTGALVSQFDLYAEGVVHRSPGLPLCANVGETVG
jgi:hypothetical protein